MIEMTPWKSWAKNRRVSLRSELDEKLNRIVRVHIPRSRKCFKASSFPLVNINESKRNITVKFKISCLEVIEDDFDVTLKARTLNIRGGNMQAGAGGLEDYRQKKRPFLYYNRKIELPAEVDLNEVKAALRKGMLVIKIKKVPDSDTAGFWVDTPLNNINENNSRNR